MPKNQPHGFLTWKVPGMFPSVRLDLDVIDRMTVEMMRSFGVSRRRGTEVGGVLLGKINSGEEPVVLVYDYEAVPCEYSMGPSYILSDRDLETFRAVISRWRREVSPDQYVVGYYRSHTRDGLFLDEADAKLFHDHLNDPLAVALVVKPYATRVNEAGFFLQSDGRLVIEASPLEFQFVRSLEAVPKAAERPVVIPQRPLPASPQSAAQTNPPVADVVPERPPERPPAQATERPPERTSARRDAKVERPTSPIFSTYYPAPEPAWKTRLLWLAFVLAVFGFGAVAGYEYAGGQIRALRAASAETRKAPADPYNINLSATAQDQTVLLKWDRDSEAAKSATRGVLTVTEGGVSKEVKLDFPELRNGTILYHRAGSEVSFKLDLYFKDNRVLSEIVTLRLDR